MVRYTDEDLLEGMKKGSDEAFRALFDIYYYRMFCVARQYLQDDFIAETVVGDLFFHLWETRKSIEIKSSLNAYLIRSTRNFSLNYLHKNYVEREVGLDAITSHLHQAEEYPLGILLEKELSEVLQKEIDKLPAETRQVFILSRIEEMKHNEIAEQLGISVNTVKYHIKQALSLLRGNLKHYLTILLFCLFSFF